MIAFVFSVGGSRGAMEAGGVKAFYEAGIRPDIVVGSSAGAMNAAFLATDPSPGGGERLCNIWRNLQNKDVVPGSLLTKAWRVLTGGKRFTGGPRRRAAMPSVFSYHTAEEITTASVSARLSDVCRSCMVMPSDCR